MITVVNKGSVRVETERKNEPESFSEGDKSAELPAKRIRPVNNVIEKFGEDLVHVVAELNRRMRLAWHPSYR